MDRTLSGSTEIVSARLAGVLPVCLLQALFVGCLLVDPENLFTQPIRSGDYLFHFYEASHAGDHLRSSGKLWGFDPFWMAGYPAGLVGILDNKLFSLLLALPPKSWHAAIFNAVVIGILLLAPVLVYLGARVAELRESDCRGAALGSVIVTFSVPAAVFFWSWGGISFFFASSLAVVVAITLANTLVEQSLSSRRGVVVAGVAMLGTFTHPVQGIILGMGLLPVLWSGSRPLRARTFDLAVLAALLALTVLPIGEAFASLRGPLRVTDPGVHEWFRGGLGQLRRDWWVHLFDTRSLHNGAGGLLVILPLAVIGTLTVIRESSSDPATGLRRLRLADQVILLEVLGSAALVYLLPSVSGRFSLLQPYRFLIPLSFFACVAAGPAIAGAMRSLAAGRPVAWALAAAAALVVANATWGLAPILALGHERDPAEVALAAFLEHSTSEEDRVAVETTLEALPVEGPIQRFIAVHRFGLLPTVVRRELIGYAGLSIFAVHRYARFEPASFFGKQLADLDEEAVAAILSRYAISWLAACTRPTLRRLADFSNVFEEVAPAGDCRIFRVRGAERSRLLEGAGRVRADVDRIAVTEAQGDRIVLKYHWLPNLCTDPPLEIEEIPQPGAPVGFIGVRPAGIRNFTIRPRHLLEVRSCRARRE